MRGNFSRKLVAKVPRGEFSAPIAQARFKPIQFRRQIALDIGNPHLDHAIVARFQPDFRAARSATMASDSPGLTSSIASRCTNETKSGMWRPTGVWRLNCPAKRRSRVSACHRMRSASVGLRRSSRASPRTVAAVAGRRGGLPVFGQQRPQPGRLFAVEHAALGRTLPALGDRHHHPMQGVHVLLGRVHPGEDVAQIDQHGLALLARAQKFDLVELPDQIVEEGLHLVLRRRLGTFGHRERQAAAGRKLEPFIAGQEHGLRQIERGKTRVDRKGNDPVGKRDLLVLESITLAPKQDAGAASACDMVDDSPAASAGATTGLAWS